MKRLILIFVLIIAIIIAMFTYTRGYYTYDDVTSTIDDVILKVKNMGKEPELAPDIEIINNDKNGVTKKSIILDKRIIPKVQNNGLNKCINDRKKIIYTQFKCPEGYTLVEDNWAKKANVMNPNETSEKNKKEWW